MGIRRVILSDGLRIAAFALLPSVDRPAVAAPDAPAVTFFCGFERSPGDCGFAEQAKSGGRASIVKLAREGWRGVRLQTRPGDDDVAGSGPAERDDLSLSQAASGCYAGREQWWAHSVLFPDDYVAPPMSTGSSWNWGVVFDFHQSAGSGPVNFEVNAMPAGAISPDRPTGLNFRGAGGDPKNPTTYGAAIGPVVRNVWYDFVYHVKWSWNSDGFFRAWVNGVRKLAYSGPTLYVNQGCYLKLANYHSAFGQPVSVIHARVVRGTSRESVAWVCANPDVVSRAIQ